MDIYRDLYLTPAGFDLQRFCTTVHPSEATTYITAAALFRNMSIVTSFSLASKAQKDTTNGARAHGLTHTSREAGCCKLDYDGIDLCAS